jgi:hypothetical protein
MANKALDMADISEECENVLRTCIDAFRSIVQYGVEIYAQDPNSNQTYLPFMHSLRSEIEEIDPGEANERFRLYFLSQPLLPVVHAAPSPEYDHYTLMEDNFMEACVRLIRSIYGQKYYGFDEELIKTIMTKIPVRDFRFAVGGATNLRNRLAEFNSMHPLFATSANQEDVLNLYELLVLTNRQLCAAHRIFNSGKM